MGGAGAYLYSESLICFEIDELMRLLSTSHKTAKIAAAWISPACVLHGRAECASFVFLIRAWHRRLLMGAALIFFSIAGVAQTIDPGQLQETRTYIKHLWRILERSNRAHYGGGGPAPLWFQ